MFDILSGAQDDGGHGPPALLSGVSTMAAWITKLPTLRGSRGNDATEAVGF